MCMRACAHTYVWVTGWERLQVSGKVSRSSYLSSVKYRIGISQPKMEGRKRIELALVKQDKLCDYPYLTLKDPVLFDWTIDFHCYVREQMSTKSLPICVYITPEIAPVINFVFTQGTWSHLVLLMNQNGRKMWWGFSLERGVGLGWRCWTLMVSLLE